LGHFVQPTPPANGLLDAREALAAVILLDINLPKVNGLRC
jgi:DNA-binding NarL/FixJ family response regulator